MDMLGQQSWGVQLFYCNPAFSSCLVFLHQCALMFLEGASVVVLVPSNTWQSFEKLYSHFTSRFCIAERAN